MLDHNRRPRHAVSRPEPTAVVARRVHAGAIVASGRPAVEQRLSDAAPIRLLDARYFERCHILAADDAYGDELDLALVEMIAIVESVLLVEAGDDLRHIRRRHRPVREIGPELEALAVITALRELLELLPLARHTVLL